MYKRSHQNTKTRRNTRRDYTNFEVLTQAIESRSDMSLRDSYQHLSNRRLGIDRWVMTVDSTATWMVDTTTGKIVCSGDCGGKCEWHDMSDFDDGYRYDGTHWYFLGMKFDPI
jgi:hypothetical protein